MIEADACKLYIAILYFDACIFQEVWEMTASTMEHSLVEGVVEVEGVSTIKAL